jgi:hypothetical protein
MKFGEPVWSQIVMPEPDIFENIDMAHQVGGFL